MNDHPATPYADLSPDLILDAVESLGLPTDGHLLALNSYENRVYQVGLDEAAPVIAKFYRPDRWSDAEILEEHAFTLELADLEIPAVPPFETGGQTLHRFAGFRFSLWPRRGGRTPELDDPDVLEWIGRFIGRIHALGAVEPFRYRPTLDIAGFGDEPRAFLLNNGWIPADLLPAYSSVVDQALEGVRACFARAGRVEHLRLHGDCHRGNMLWTDAGPHFVDFDDARMGPAVQDLWMLLSGERRGDVRPARRRAGRLRGLPRVRPPRAAPDRGPAHAAPDPLRGLARPALGRPRLPRRLPLVQRPSAIGRTTSWRCASRSRPWRRARCGPCPDESPCGQARWTAATATGSTLSAETPDAGPSTLPLRLRPRLLGLLRALPRRDRPARDRGGPDALPLHRLYPRRWRLPDRNLAPHHPP